ncbi:MAG: MFS transporter [Steroidobacteraceae bacterium]
MKATSSLFNRSTLRAIPPGIWALGFVSMLMDISSEMIHALLPVYLVTVLGASATTVGAIEGIAEATASVTKVFSGALSDWLGKRKLLAALGYGLAAITKPIFPLAPTIGWLVAARFIDRIGKGIRGAPRDALLADIAPAPLRGASFGLRQSLDTVGAFIGPLLAIGLMWLTANNFRTVFWVAVLPAFLSLAVMIFAVREPARTDIRRSARMPLRRRELARLGPQCWLVIAVATVFTLARFSEAFLVLRAQAVGLPIALVPLVLVVMNVVYSIAAYPAGVASDRLGRYHVLALGIGLLIAADLVLAIVPGLWGVAAGVAMWGLHMAFTQGLFAAWIADTAPADLRGTAFGMFNLLTGVALLLASMAAGLLWDALGAPAMFLVGAAVAVVAQLTLFAAKQRLGPGHRVN